MKYLSFRIQNYRAIRDLTINLGKKIIPLVGINECGKTTILQAIKAFDSSNDSTDDGKHLKSTGNLYSTTGDALATITASIELDDEVIEDLSTATDNEEAKKAIKTVLEKNKNSFKLTRTIKDDTESVYSSPYEDEITENMPEEVKVEAKAILKQMYIIFMQTSPFILYNDDFNDRPPGTISVATENDWAIILDRVFKSHPKKYGIKYFKKQQPKTKKSILSDINQHLSKLLTEEWSRYTPDKKQKIAIEIEESQTVADAFDISVKETTEEGERYFSIEDRSKGFIWNYNFIMKTLFSPKESFDKGQTIFLLDEPGSYLHSSAQTSLCKKIKEISEKEGIVIYCTHTPQLLDPSYIPINNILVVEKSQKKGVHTLTVGDASNKRSKKTHMQPIYDALQIPEISKVGENDKLLYVEGINDMYCLELFGNLDENVKIIPGTNAESIISNIQYAIGYNIPYVALWDNDTEGRKYHKHALEVFGPEEAKKMILLPATKKERSRMEEMIDDKDYTYLRESLKLNNDASYPSILYAIREKKPNEIKKIIDQVGNITKGHFIKLSQQLESILNA